MLKFFRANGFSALVLVSIIGLSGCGLLDGLSGPDPAFESLALWPQYADALPGDTIEYLVGEWLCCYIFEESDVRASWSVEPSGAAQISNDGVLQVLNSAQPGQELIVRARAPRGLNLEARVVVFTFETNPLVGAWYEEKQILCSGQEREPKERFEELIFNANGHFSLTWFPFEVYQDYWGNFEFDLDRRDLSLVIEAGNFIPEDAHLAGKFVVASRDSIRLENLFLGSPSRDEPETGVCGHLLRRLGT